MDRNGLTALKIVDDHAGRIRSLEDCTKQISIQLATLTTDLQYTKETTLEVWEDVRTISDTVAANSKTLDRVLEAHQKRSKLWTETRYRLLLPLLVIFAAVFVSGAAGSIWSFFFGG